MDAKAMRELVNLLVEKTGKIAALFSGSTKDGFSYIIGSKHLDMRQTAKEMNAALNGRGGGSAQMAQGTVFAQRKAIEEFMNGK